MTQATQEKTLDQLREQAQSLSKSIQAAFGADEAQAKAGLEKATLAAQQIQTKLAETAAEHDAERKKRLAEAVAQFAETAAKGSAAIKARGADLKAKTLEMDAAAKTALNKLTDAVAVQRAKG
ncbi:MAG TPA: hypothetical protein VMU38_11080 [Candidatus Binatia bacterium]|nr:hypothetical protein [Candidatus Binatia bacterium]